MSPSASTRLKKNKQAVIEDLTASPKECEQALLELCAFEHEGAVYRPSARALLGVWKAILSVATSEEIDLCSKLEMSALLCLLEDEMWPRGLVEAVMARLAVEIDGKLRSIGYEIPYAHKADNVKQRFQSTRSSACPGLDYRF